MIGGNFQGNSKGFRGLDFFERQDAAEEGIPSEKIMDDF